MNNRVNYTLVGFFVLIGILLISGFTYWIVKPSNDTNMKKYTIYFDESVLGLNIDSPIKYRGIDVGKVISLKINEKNTEQINVTIDILKTTPVKTNTVAKLTAQGITGLSYINLTKGSSQNSDALVVEVGEKYPIIKTEVSFFENIENSLDSVSSKLSSTLGKTEELLRAENQEQISLLLKSSAGVMQRMEKVLADKTVDNLQSSIENLNSFSDKLNAILPDIKNFVDKSGKWEDNISGSFSSIQKSYVGIHSSMMEIKKAVASDEFNFKEITADVVPTINSTFLELQDTIIKFDNMIQQYERNPSDILYKREAVKIAPGEE